MLIILSNWWPTLSFSSGYPKKRKRTDDDSRSDTPNLAGSSISNVPTNLCFGCICQSYSTPYGRPYKEIRTDTSLHGDDMKTIGAACANNEGILSGQCQESSTQSVVNTRKRSRQPRWQRHRKRRLLSSQETYTREHSRQYDFNMKVCFTKNHYGFNTFALYPGWACTL